MDAQMQRMLRMIGDARAATLEAISGLSAEALNWRPCPGANSIFALVSHMAGSEMWLITQNVAGRDVGRDRDAEFSAAGDNVAALREALETAGRLSHDALEPLKTSDLTSTRMLRGQERTVEWLILHVLEHDMLHLGHIELTRQLWEQRTRSGTAG